MAAIALVLDKLNLFSHSSCLVLTIKQAEKAANIPEDTMIGAILRFFHLLEKNSWVKYIVAKVLEMERHLLKNYF